MTTIQRGNRKDIHYSKDNRKKCCQVPECLPIPDSRKDAANCYEATKRLICFCMSRKNELELFQIVTYRPEAFAYTCGNRLQKSIFNCLQFKNLVSPVAYYSNQSSTGWC